MGGPAQQRVLWALAPLATLASGVAAQTVHGRVLGFDGAPVRGATVRFVSHSGASIGEELSAADGSYACDHAAVAAVIVQLEGVRLSGVPSRAPAATDFSFAGVRHFTLRGHVVDPSGAPAGFVDVHARFDDNALAVATTDPRGAFSLRVDRPVAEVIADPLGWEHRVAGPFRGDTGLAMDLRLEIDRFFRLTGTVLDEDGRPLAMALVRAHELRDDPAPAGRDEKLFHARTDAEGRYSLWANAPVARVSVRSALEPRCEARGPWRSAARVHLDCRTDGFVRVIGRVLGADGKGVAGANLFPVDERGRKVPVLLGVSGQDGWFRISIVRSAPGLLAEKGGRALRADGPWVTDRPVLVRPAR